MADIRFSELDVLTSTSASDKMLLYDDSTTYDRWRYFGDIKEDILDTPVIGTSLDCDGNEVILDADGDTSITADTDDQIDIKIGNANQIKFKDGVIEPVTDNDIDLGTSTKEFKDLYIDGTAYIDDLHIDDDIAFEQGTAHTIEVNQTEAASGNGSNLTIRAGAGGATNSDGGNLLLDGGANAGTGDDGDIQIGVNAGNCEIHSGKFLFSATKQSLNDSSPVEITTPITEVDSSGGAFTSNMADGSQGQIKFIVMVAAASDAVIEPANFGNGTSITMGAVGDACTLLFSGGKWWVMGQNSITIT